MERDIERTVGCVGAELPHRRDAWCVVWDIFANLFDDTDYVIGELVG